MPYITKREEAELSSTPSHTNLNLEGAQLSIKKNFLLMKVIKPCSFS